MGMWDLQVAIKAKLDANGTLIAMLADGADSIRDSIREDDSFPYVSIYNVSTKELDTVLTNGFESLVAIHIYSRYEGQKEVKEIADQVYASLHKQDLTMGSGTHVLTTFTNSSFFLEGDGETRHGQLNFKIVTE